MILGICQMHDEADVAEHVVRYHLEHCDRVIVADNLSTDGTRDILAGLPVTLLDDMEPAHHHGRKITALVHQYATEGDWVVPFDADELWTGEHAPLGQTLRESHADVLYATMFGYWPHPTADPTEPNPFRRIRYRVTAINPLPKVAFRYHPNAIVHDGNHGVDHLGARAPGLRIAHFQYRSLEQMTRKVRYGWKSAQLTGNGNGFSGHWGQLATLSDQDLSEVWEQMRSAATELDPCL